VYGLKLDYKSLPHFHFINVSYLFGRELTQCISGKDLQDIISQDLGPFPKAPPRKQSKRGRNPGRCMVASDTPENYALQSKEIIKEAKTLLLY